jgi:hypothetical protein
MTTFDPDTRAQDVRGLRDIVERFGGTMCLNAMGPGPPPVIPDRGVA